MLEPFRVRFEIRDPPHVVPVCLRAGIPLTSSRYAFEPGSPSRRPGMPSSRDPSHLSIVDIFLDTKVKRKTMGPGSTAYRGDVEDGPRLNGIPGRLFILYILVIILRDLWPQIPRPYDCLATAQRRFSYCLAMSCRQFFAAQRLLCTL